MFMIMRSRRHLGIKGPPPKPLGWKIWTLFAVWGVLLIVSVGGCIHDMNSRKRCIPTIDVDGKTCRVISWCQPCNPTTVWHERVTCNFEGRPEGDECPQQK